MASANQIAEVLRKVSLASAKSMNSKVLYPIKSDPLPRDKLYLGRILFALFGILHILPDTFFVTANEYWMYKFRDASSEMVDSNNRTVLQTNFATGSSVVSTIPKIITMFLFTAFRHKLNVKTNILLSLTITVGCFAVFTGFIDINTDPWQTVFFGLTMSTLALINIALTVFQMSSLVILAKFPPIYMKSFLFGKGTTGILTSSLEIMSLSIGTSTKVSASIYFMLGTLIIFFTLALFFLNTRLPFYSYYVENAKDDIKRKESFTFAEILMVSKEIWTALSIFILSVVTIVLIHTNMTTLVVSEGYGHNNSWNDLYFVPVITFLSSDIFQMTGRLCASDVIKESAGPWWVILEASRMMFIPLIMFCNVLPRHHLPVLFPHDWQYTTILGVYQFTNGFSFSSVFLSIPKQTKHEELAYFLLMIGASVTAGITSFISVVVINLI